MDALVLMGIEKSDEAGRLLTSDTLLLDNACLIAFLNVTSG
jgi:hypothetical protein